MREGGSRPDNGTGRRRRGRLATRISASGIALTVLAAAAALGISVGPASPAHAAEPVTFTVGMTGSVDSFNPFDGITAESYEMWALMYDYMITYSDKDMSPQPGLASKWTTSDDGLTWTFDIVKGVKWSDGKPLTAADIAYTYNRILDGGPESASWGSYLNNVDKITAPSATKVVLQLKKPNAVLPLLPIPIIPEHIWKNVPEDEVKSYTNEPKDGVPPVGSGPFRLVQGQAGGNTYVFERNPDYWNGEPSMDKVVYNVYRSEDTLVQALTAGEIDFAEGITPLQYQSLKGKDNITAVQGISPGFDEIAFNTGSINTTTGKPIGDPNPAVLDPKFRFALNFAVDREKIVEQAYQGAAVPGKTIIPPPYTNYQWTNPDPDAYTYDPDHAKELLDEAGYKVGSDGWRTMPDGSPIGQLRLFARSDSSTSLSTMELFQEWLKGINIDSKVVSVGSNQLTNIILDGDYDLFQWGWYVEPDPDSMLSYFTCGQLGSWSDSWYCTKKYDRLYEEQNSATDQTKREDIIKQMQAMLYPAMPYIVTAYTDIDEAYRSDRWTGFVPQPNPGGIMLFQYGVANYLGITPVTEDIAGASEGLSSGEIIGLGVAGILLFIAGGSIGSFAGYRKASVDFRE